MKKTFLTFIVSLILISGIKFTYSDDYTDAIIKAKKNLHAMNDSSDRTKLLKVRGDFERTLQLKKNEWMTDYWLAFVDILTAWSYMDITNGKSDKDNIKKYTESCISLLDKATNIKDDFADAYILKMAAQGNRWMYEPDKMNDIITKMSDAKETAKKLDANNPRLYLVEAQGIYYTPEAFGGGPDKAKPEFEKSWDLFQTYKIKDDTYPDWGIDQAAGMIAMCYISNDKPEDAKKWIDKALEVNPNSGFIKNYVQKQYDEKVKK